MNITGGTINIHAENGENDVISLSCGDNHLHIAPNIFRVINQNRNAVQIIGSMIRGFSYFWQGEFNETFTLDSATGNISTSGDISAKELFYLCNGEHTSVRVEIDRINSEINNLSGKIQSNYDDLWGQIMQMRGELDAITGRTTS